MIQPIQFSLSSAHSPAAARRQNIGANNYRYLGQTPGRLMCVLTPAGFEEFFEDIGALSPQQRQDIPRVIEIARTYGLEILPPPGA